jgi:beta-N-acetylhexosaminidase
VISAAQLVMFGYDRPTLDADFRSLVERQPLAGVLLHGDALGPPDQVRALTSEIQRSAAGAAGTSAPPPTLLIAVDQEGGRAQAWGPPHQEPIPAAAEIGWEYEASGERLEITLLGMEVGRRLQAAGINLNFAPVLDVHTRPGNPIIGDRSYGPRPELVAEAGGAFIEGLQAAGVLACGKHFPGHGDTEVDSHLALPAVSHGEERLRTVELVPFAMAISRGLEMVMTAHVLYPAWDAERPATVSPAIVDGVLRRELGFSGVVVTDALEMQGLRQRHDLVEAALLALGAGCDLLLSVEEPERRQELLDGLDRALGDGRLSRERLEESLRRVATLKLDWLAAA